MWNGYNNGTDSATQTAITAAMKSHACGEINIDWKHTLASAGCRCCSCCRCSLRLRLLLLFTSFREKCIRIRIENQAKHRFLFTFGLFKVSDYEGSVHSTDSYDGHMHHIRVQYNFLMIILKSITFHWPGNERAGTRWMWMYTSAWCVSVCTYNIYAQLAIVEVFEW